MREVNTLKRKEDCLWLPKIIDRQIGGNRRAVPAYQGGFFYFKQLTLFKEIYYGRYESGGWLYDESKR
jgi:hypothetical protein